MASRGARVAEIRAFAGAAPTRSTHRRRAFPLHACGERWPQRLARAYGASQARRDGEGPGELPQASPLRRAEVDAGTKSPGPSPAASPRTKSGESVDLSPQANGIHTSLRAANNANTRARVPSPVYGRRCLSRSREADEGRFRTAPAPSSALRQGEGHLLPQSGRRHAHARFCDFWCRYRCVNAVAPQAGARSEENGLPRRSAAPERG
jgi:hypothetical protein